ncbi:UNVERIFIED_CONTAM: putative acyl-activating enzyme 19, partial [Sesamum radiatum]
MEPSVEYIVAVLSVLRCGEAFMPLDPTWPKSRILSLLSSSKADLVIGIQSPIEGNCCHKLDTLQWLIDEVTCPVLPVSMKENIKEQSHPLLMAWPCESESSRSFCYLMYTSGSSGNPKGGYFINRLVAVPSLMRAIIPSLQSPSSVVIQDSLKLLVLSGEVLRLSLCKMLLKLLPQTLILNLYGSTEVSGDCTYFDCKRLPLILEKEVLSSVPVGLPVSNYEDLSPEHDARYPSSGCGVQHYFKTGDFARKLSSGDLVFLGRKDLLSREVDGEILLLEAHVVTEKTLENDHLLKSSLSNWVLGKLPAIMIPRRIFFTRLLPLTSSGKVDYLSLAASTSPDQQARVNVDEIPQDHLLEVIKKVFSDALMVEKVSNDDDFFYDGCLQMALSSTSSAIGTDGHLRMDLRCQKKCFSPGNQEFPIFREASLTEVWSNIIQRDGKGFMRELWKVEMDSCVDASPLLVFKGSALYVFIGSHSRKFVCVDGKSGVVQWETKLEGRVECSAAILDDFSQVRTDGPIFAGPCTSQALPSQ